jgi:hypothetical protein
VLAAQKAEASPARQAPEVLAMRQELAARLKMPAEYRQPADQHRIAQLRELLGAVTAEGGSAAAFGFWRGLQTSLIRSGAWLDPAIKTNEERNTFWLATTDAVTVNLLDRTAAVTWR